MGVIRAGTTIVWGQAPLWFAGDEMEEQQYNFRSNYLISANMPMIYQAIWAGGTPAVDEEYPPALEGDIVNVIFKVYATTDYPNPAASSDWDLIGQIKKTRDIPNTNIVNSNTPASQSYTIDISRLVADQLSYSLVPIGKGSWQNQEYGGMNGGETKQDNIIETVSPYNVTRNGAYRAIRVVADVEMLNADGLIEVSTTTLSAASVVRVVNSVPAFNLNTFYNQVFTLNQYSGSQDSQKRALTNSPNSTLTTAIVPSYKKSLRITDKAEFLQFFVRVAFNGAFPADFYNLYEMYGQAVNKDGSLGLDFVLGSSWKNNNGTTNINSDISHSFQKETANTFKQAQNQLAVQNVSAGYINEHAYAPQDSNYPYVTARTPITANTSHYYVYVRGNYENGAGSWVVREHSNVYWYEVNDEDIKLTYEPVRFHWLNTVGGIDSYTARRDIMESISIEKSLMETQLPGRRYMQDNTDSAGVAIADSAYYSDTMRGFDTYKGGTEVLSVNAKVNNSVYTEPLNKLEATWLREMFQSPNVWIEEDTEDSDQVNYQLDAPFHMNQMNPYLRPAKTIYKPVIINNTEVSSLDQEKGLVMYNIEYTLSQGILTQRN